MANATPRRGIDAEGRVVKAADSVTWRSLEILGAFDERHTHLSLSELSRRAALPIATAHRLSAELVRWGALERSGSDFVIGQRLWRIATLAPVQKDIAEIAAPHMQDVLFVTQNVVNLFILDGSSVLLLDRISGTRAGAPFRRPGSHLGLHASAAGKVMLAYEGLELLPRIGKLEAFTRHTITDRSRLAEEVKAVRQQGFGVSNQESGEDNFGLAVPVILPSGKIAAAIGVVSQKNPPPVGTVVPVLRIAARGIARGLVSRELA